MFEFYADKNRLILRAKEPVTSGSVNVYMARFTFSADWDGLVKTAVFRAGGSAVSIPLSESGECSIPWEVLGEPRTQLYAEVRGCYGNKVILPTQWVYLGTILDGVAPGDEAPPPLPEHWEQELAGKGDALSYDGLNLSLMSGDNPLSTVTISGGSGEGGPSYQFGHGLKLTGATVSVDTVDNFSGDNTLPMTAAGVQATVGNIEALLGTI